MEKLCLILVVSLVLTFGCVVSAEEGTLEYPCCLLDAYDADNSGWEGIGVDGDWPVPVIPEEWLVGPPPAESSAVTLPPDHWVELKFCGELVDGPGDDILLIEWGLAGEKALIFIADDAGQEYLLGMGEAGDSGGQSPTEINFNMPDVSLPFTASVIRVLGTSEGGGSPGFDLGNVRMRTSADYWNFAWFPSPSDFASLGWTADGVELSWKPGDNAVSHDVYVGANWDDVNDANRASHPSLLYYSENQDPCEYGPIPLHIDTTYYWRVDEVNGPTIWKGRVWRYSTVDLIVVDDIEYYDDYTTPNVEGGRIWFWWEQGVGFTTPYTYPGNGTGSGLGYWPAPICEEDNTHGGEKAMPYFYDNSGSGGNAYYSEASAKTVAGPNSLRITEKWYSEGGRSLSIWFYGDPGNDVTVTEQMWVGLSDGDGQFMDLPYNGDMSDIQQAEWQEWNIDLSDFTGVDLDDVQRIYIGFGDRDTHPVPGGSGLVLFDDITLYPVRCLQENRPDADFNSDCIVDFEDLEELAYSWLDTRYKVYPVTEPNAPLLWYEFEGNLNDSSSNGYHGAHSGEPNYVSGFYGSAMSFDGYQDSVAITDAEELFGGISDGITIAFWQYGLDSPHLNDTLCCSNYTYDTNGPAMPIISGPAVAVNLGCWRAPGRYNWDCGHPWSFDNRLSGSHLYKSEWSGQWNHWAFTKNAQTGTMEIFLNGVLYDSRTGADSPISAVTSFQIGSGWYGKYDGLIDDFRIYDYALSQPEIACVATNGTGIFDIPLVTPADLFKDELINFRDFAILANSWLEGQLWP